MARPVNTQPLTDALIALTVNGPQTRSALGLSNYRLTSLLGDGLVKAAGIEKVTDADGNPSRGRPRHLFRATDKGRKRAKRILARQVAAA